MGRNNRERRAAKSRKRAGQGRVRHSAHSAHDEHDEHGRTTTTTFGDGAKPDLRDVAAAAVQACAVGETDDANALIDWMMGEWEAGHLAATFDRMVDRTLDGLWDDGWQPAEVARLAERKRTKAATAQLVHLIAANSRGYRHAADPEPEWIGQLVAMGADHAGVTLAERSTRAGSQMNEVLHHTVALLALLSRLSSLPKLMPPPSEWSSHVRVTHRHAGVDPKILDRVRALLAKAESTEFAEEAAAFTAKAQELITRHALDRAVIDAATDESVPIARRITIDSPYVEAKASLLNVIAVTNRCRTVLHSELGMVSLFGYASDLDAVELLYASLLVQATGSVTAMGPQRDARGRSRTRSFRQSFFYGFAHTISERLETAASTVTEEMTRADDRLLPVLAARDQRVDDAVEAAFPDLRRVRSPVSNYDGYVAGRAAGETATLDVRPRLEHQAS